MHNNILFFLMCFSADISGFRKMAAQYPVLDVKVLMG